jgi:hypothetical protein
LPNPKTVRDGYRMAQAGRVRAPQIVAHIGDEALRQMGFDPEDYPVAAPGWRQIDTTDDSEGHDVDL